MNKKSFIFLRVVAAWLFFLYATCSFSQGTVQTSEGSKTEEPVTIISKEGAHANPYGLASLWQQSDYVAKSTLVILLLMSIGSWYILVVKLFEQWQLFKDARSTIDFWQKTTLSSGLDGLQPGSAFRLIAQTAVKAGEHHEGVLLEKIALNEWVTVSIERAVERIQSTLQKGLAFLATVGSTAPFIGLFGTVWGIYGALTKIGIAGQATIDKVAGPVGEALIMTAFGLFVAVPAVLGYNLLVRRNKVAMEKVRIFAADVHLVAVSGVMQASVAHTQNPQTDRK